MKYRTAETLEDLDMEDELNSFESVGHAMHVQLNKASIDECFHKYDYYLIMLDEVDVEAIFELLSSLNYSGALEFESKFLVFTGGKAVELEGGVS